MGGFLKQATASQSRMLGPFVDDTDGTTAETGLTIANTDIRLSVNGGNMAAKNSGGGTHDELGYYTYTLDATDTATVGHLKVMCKMAGALVVEDEFWVLEEAIYDALFAASAAAFDSNQRVDVGSVGGTAQTANDNGADINAILNDTNELQTNQGDWATATGFAIPGDQMDLVNAPNATALAAAADAHLDRDMSTGADNGSSSVRTPRQALRALRNKVSISGGIMTVTKEDDSTASWTAAVTTSASADPITAVDPAGP